MLADVPASVQFQSRATGVRVMWAPHLRFRSPALHTVWFQPRVSSRVGGFCRFPVSATRLLVSARDVAKSESMERHERKAWFTFHV